jgi:FkbM family methyltransferase
MLTSVLLSLMSFLGKKLRRSSLARSPMLNRVFATMTLRVHGSSEANVGSFRIQFDPRDQFIARKLVLYGGYEEKDIELLCSLVKPGDHVLDIGANIGLYSLYLSRAVGRTGRVIAVEPDPDNLSLLHKNLEANSCENVTVIPCAFGVESGYRELFQREDNRGNLSFADLGGTGCSVSISVRRGEEVVAELKSRPTAAKIDVEGAEPLVLSGLGTRKPDILLFEFVPQNLKSLGHDPEAFLGSLVVEGYTLELIDPDSGARTQGSPSAVCRLAVELAKNCNVLATR